MKSLSVLAMGLVLVGCNGTGGGSSNVGTSSMVTAFPIDTFESEIKERAELLENEAVFRFNPCRDELNWVDTGATSGTVEISGYQFQTNNISSIVRESECKVRINSSLGGHREAFTMASVGAKFELTGDYTALLLVQGGDLSFNNSAGTTRPTIQQTEVTTFAQLYMAEGTGDISFSEAHEAIVKRTDVEQSVGYAVFEVNKTDNSVDIQHYNSRVGEIPTSIKVHPEFDELKHTKTVSDLSISGIYGVTVGENNGPIGFMFFDRILTAEEKQLMSCYALYLSTKSGDMGLWNKLSNRVCTGL